MSRDIPASTTLLCPELTHRGGVLVLVLVLVLVQACFSLFGTTIWRGGPTG
jgi:hypothetical protein